MKNICFKKFFASFLTFLFLMQQTMVLPAFASDITGSIPGNIESNPIKMDIIQNLISDQILTVVTLVLNTIQTLICLRGM